MLQLDFAVLPSTRCEHRCYQQLVILAAMIVIRSLLQPRLLDVLEDALRLPVAVAHLARLWPHSRMVGW